MKSRFTFLLAAILCMLCGCTAGMNDKGQAVSVTVLETDLESIEALFNQPQNNGLLVSVFDDVSDIDLSQVFYNGAGVTNSVTEEERELYCRTLGIDPAPLDMTKITTAQANGFLAKWLGIGLSGVNTSLADYDGWLYLEDYDAYYFLHGDTNYQELDFISGEAAADQKQISVVYSLGEPAEYRTATIKMNDDGECTLISNCSHSAQESSKDAPGDSADAPTLLSMQILDPEGKQITQYEADWISLTPKCIISVDYKGTVTQAEFYAVPSGTETDFEKFLIGTVDTGDIADSTVSLEWEPPSGFKGYVSVVLYNGEASVSSEGRYLIKVLEKASGEAISDEQQDALLERIITAYEASASLPG